MKRSGKFYSKNEKETLKKLGLKPIAFSGAGWIDKEDGESEKALVQLKSTEASSYRVDMLDIKKLEYHASVSHKVPIFIIQFLKQDKIYALVNLEDLDDLNDILNGNQVKRKIEIKENTEELVERRKIQSSQKARNKFFEEREKLYGKRKRD